MTTRPNPRPGLRRPISMLYALLLAANVAAWLWALLLFQGQPAMLGTALLAYGLGLRHAVDADHIAAIDNVTRKLMDDGQRPIAAGLFFALGHSTVVTLAAAAVALTASAAMGRFEEVRALGGLVGTAVSALFLLAIAAVNLVVLLRLWRALRRVRAGCTAAEAGPDAEGGVLARLFRPLFRLVTRSWHMAPLGFLFGLGFDTATEVSLLGLAATQAGQGLSIWSIMLFPALFAAGMALVDTTDGVLMLGAYDRALARPTWTLSYRLVVTLVSVVVAAGIGGMEALGLVGEHFALEGALWGGVASLNEHSTALGLGIIGVFCTAWAASVLLYRGRGPGGAEAPTGGT